MKQTTKQSLIDALNRLLKGEPTNFELKKRARQGKLKVNNNTVEIEAGFTTGSLRNHSDIKKMIKSRSRKAKVNNSETAASEIELLEQENTILKSDKTHLTKLKSKHLADSRKNEYELAIQAAIHIKIVQELMEMIPESQREAAMDKVVNTRPDNVVKGNFR